MLQAQNFTPVPVNREWRKYFWCLKKLNLIRLKNVVNPNACKYLWLIQF
jgi:hypothetical protein